MKQTCRTLLLAALAAVAAMPLRGVEPLPLTIYSGAPDTVRASRTTIVGVTAPGASASIGGEAVRVYRTGSFGREVTLAPGQNRVPVEVALGDRKAEKHSKYSTTTQLPALRVKKPSPSRLVLWSRAMSNRSPALTCSTATATTASEAPKWDSSTKV